MVGNLKQPRSEGFEPCSVHFVGRLYFPRDGLDNWAMVQETSDTEQKAHPQSAAAAAARCRTARVRRGGRAPDPRRCACKRLIDRQVVID